jgi:hypothetical protein
MKISVRSIQALGKIVTGDEGLSRYRSGPMLVELFNEFGANDRYGRGFPSRWQYAEATLHAINGTKVLSALIRNVFDPREFLEAKKEVQPAIDYLNQRLKYDGYELVKDGDFVKVRDVDGIMVDMRSPFEGSEDDAHVFIDEQILKSETKIQEGDYDGAITNAKALLEAVLTEIEKQFDATAPEYDGDMIKLFRRVQRQLNLDPSRADVDSTLKQVLGGLASIISGLARLRNKMSDAHVRSYKPRKHHAVLVVNASKTLANFLFETVTYQKSK